MLMFQGSAARGRRCSAEQADPHAAVQGQFHIAVSTREVFVGTFYVAAGFLILGLAAYYCFRRLPLAALDGRSNSWTPSNPSCCRRRSSWKCRTCGSTRRSTTCRRACACSTASRSWSSATRPTRACTACRRSWPSRARPSRDIIQHRIGERPARRASRPTNTCATCANPSPTADAGDQDPRAQRRAHHRHQASADAGRRLGRRRTRTSPSTGASRRASPTWRTTTC